MGYRRAAALGRRASGMLAGTSGLPAGNKLARESRRKRHVAREAFRFTRDVRDGMELYIARHPRHSGSTLSRHTDHDDEGDGR